MEDTCFSIELAAHALPNIDSLGTIDPYVTIENNENARVARTHYMRNNVNPMWPKVQVPVDRLTFGLDREHCDPLNVVFNVYNHNLFRQDDLVGSICIQVADLFEVHHEGKFKAWILNNQDNPECTIIIKEIRLIRNELMIQAVEDAIVKDMDMEANKELMGKLEKKVNLNLILKFSAHNLSNFDFIGKSDPYLEVWTLKKQLLRKTECVKNNLNPTWKQFAIDQRLFAPEWRFQQLLLKVYDRDLIGRDDFMGQAEINSKLLIAAALQKKSLTWKLHRKSSEDNSDYETQVSTGVLKLNYAVPNKDIMEAMKAAEENKNANLALLLEESIFYSNAARRGSRLPSLSHRLRSENDEEDDDELHELLNPVQNSKPPLITVTAPATTDKNKEFTQSTETYPEIVDAEEKPGPSRVRAET